MLDSVDVDLKLKHNKISHVALGDINYLDLTTDKKSVLTDNTVDVMWTNKPTLNSGWCNLQGVLKITP